MDGWREERLSIEGEAGSMIKRRFNHDHRGFKRKNIFSPNSAFTKCNNPGFSFWSLGGPQSLGLLRRVTTDTFTYLCLTGFIHFIFYFVTNCKATHCDDVIFHVGAWLKKSFIIIIHLKTNSECHHRRQIVGQHFNELDSLNWISYQQTLV